MGAKLKANALVSNFKVGDPEFDKDYLLICIAYGNEVYSHLI